MTVFSSFAANVCFSIFLLLLSIIILWKAADYLVESASRIAKRMGISELVIGLTIVAFGTSAPELAVSVSSAIGGNSNIAIGNVVGSNIFNMGFILGISALFHGIKTSPKLVWRDGSFMVLISALLILFFLNGNLSRTEGLVLIILLAGYLFWLFRSGETGQEDDDENKKAVPLWKDCIILPVSIGFTVLGGNLLVESASFLARAAGVSEWVIGITIVAAGTSAPEMATSIVAAVKKKYSMSAGNLIGSNIFNILGILGIAGIITPLDIIQGTGILSLVMLTVLSIVVVIFMRTGWEVSRKEAVLLLAVSTAIWVWNFSL